MTGKFRNFATSGGLRQENLRKFVTIAEYSCTRKFPVLQYKGKTRNF